MDTTIGVIFGNRDFFPDHLVTEARKEISKILKDHSITGIMLQENDSKLGGVETYQDAKKCAGLFRKYRDRISGVLVVLPNFGDEKGVADTLKLSGLDVPVLIQAYPDEPGKMDPANRRDACCGKISVTNNLYQYGIKCSLTRHHVCTPSDDAFISDLKKFVAVCRVVKGLKNVRIGAIGARPGAFNTVRYSEKILQNHGISVTTVDFSEILGKAGKLSADDPQVREHMEKIKAYVKTGDTPKEKLLHIARLDAVLKEFVEEHDLDATAIQCWTSIQQNFGCNVCTSMSMMSENMLPSACEVDVTGALTMYAMQLASDSPSALVDWNNNYDSDEDKCVLFHCGNWAKSFIPGMKLSNAPILGTTVGVDNTWGALEGRAPAGPITFGRISSDDSWGVLKAYIGEGSLTDDELNTFGSRAVAHIPDLQVLMQYICRNGFEHHVAMNASRTADILEEAFVNYLDWEVYRHN